MKKSTKSFSSKFFFLFLSLILLLSSNAWGSKKIIDKTQSINKTNTANAGDIIVKKWADDKKSAFSFSFDDSYETHYTNVRPILNQFGFHGTFYIIAGEINDNYPAEWRYGIWSQFLEMAQEGHEMGAHTMTHPHLPKLNVGDINTPGTIKYELYQAKNIIENKIGQDVISIAYPYTEHNTTVDNIASQYYVNGRAMGDLPNSSSPSGNQWYGLTAKEPEFNDPRNSLDDDLDELNEYKNYLLNSINNEKWTIFFGHEVLPFSHMVDSLNSMYLPISNEWLTEFTQYVKDKSDNNDVWVETVGNVTRYIKERDNFYFNIVSNTSNQITIDIGDGLDDNIFNYPLTVDIAIPNNWSDVLFTQNNVSQTITPFTVSGTKYISVKVDPSGSDVTIQNSATIFTITSSAGSGGNVTPLGNTSVDQGNSQDFTITPNTGYQIENITVDGNSVVVTSPAGQTYTFTNVTADHNITATFSIIQLSITASTSANGTITPSGNVLVNYGSNKSFTITPNSGYMIESISVDGNPVTVTSTSGQTYTFTNVITNHSISATFVNQQLTILVSASANGTITPSGSVLVNYGTNKSFAITPNAGYKIGSITVDGNPETVTTYSGQTYTFTNVTANHSISTTFIEDIVYYTFSGKVLYGNTSNTPLQNVTVKITSSSANFEATTNSSGDFQINNLIPGTYQISFSTANNWGGVNATDALRTVRVFANLDAFTSLQNIAGDVNDDGNVNSTDALLIARRFAGLIQTFSIPEWVYDAPASITIANQNVTLNIQSLAAGDVDGSLMP